jgi:hypothetical protein
VAEIPKSRLVLTAPAVALTVAAPTVAALAGLMLTEATPLESVSAVAVDKLTAVALVVIVKLTKVLAMGTPADVAYLTLRLWPAPKLRLFTTVPAVFTRDKVTTFALVEVILSLVFVSVSVLLMLPLALPPPPPHPATSNTKALAASHTPIFFIIFPL